MLAFHGLLPSKVAIPKAKTAIDAALRLDGTNSRAHGALAWIRFFYDWDWTGAEKEFRRAVELDPGWSNVRQWFAFGLLSRGKFAEAIAQCREAMELEPLSYITSGDLGVIHYYARNYQEAMREARQTLEMDSGNEAAHALMGLCFAALGRYEDAIAEYRKAMGPLKQVNTVVGRLGQACAMAGSRNEASALLDLLARDPSRKTIPHVEMAYIFLGLGDLDRTFEMLEKALQEHEAELVFLNVEPAFDPLRSDPRFIAMLKKVGF
jgi:Tfp pilus assembly protein PilF